MIYIISAALLVLSNAICYLEAQVTNSSVRSETIHLKDNNASLFSSPQSKNGSVSNTTITKNFEKIDKQRRKNYKKWKHGKKWEMSDLLPDLSEIIKLAGNNSKLALIENATLNSSKQILRIKTSSAPTSTKEQEFSEIDFLATTDSVKLLNNETKIQHKDTINSSQKYQVLTENDHNFHDKVSKNKSKKHRFKKLESSNATSTKKSYQTTKGKIENNKTLISDKHKKNLNTNNSISKQEINQKSQKVEKPTKNARISIEEDVSEPKVIVIKKSKKPKTKTFIQNPYFIITSTPSDKNLNTSEKVSKLTTKLSNLGDRKNKSQNNNLVKTDNLKTVSKLLANSSILLKTPHIKNKYLVRNHQSHSKSVKSEQENKRKQKNIKGYAKTKSKKATEHTIPTFTDLDLKLFVTVKSTDIEFVKNYTQTTKFKELRVFSGPYTTTDKSTAPHSSEADDTDNETGKKSESLEDDKMNKKIVASKTGELSDVSDVYSSKYLKDKQGENAYEVFEDAEVFRTKMKRAKAYAETNFSDDGELLSESFSELEDKTDENDDKSKDYIKSKETVTTKSNHQSAIPILQDGKVKDRFDDNEVKTKTEERGKHTPKWKKLHYVSNYSDEEDLIKENVNRALDRIKN